MNKKRQHQRLNELFSGLELLAINPAGNPSEIQHEPESLHSPLVHLEKPFLEYEYGAGGIEATSFANPQGEPQRSDELIVYEHDHLRYGYPNDKLESLYASTLSLPSSAPAIPSLLRSDEETTGEMQIAPPPDRQLINTDDELSLMTWQALGIGTLSGTLVTALVLASTFQMDIFNNLGRFALAVGEIVFGLLGALSNLHSRKTRREIWIGAIGWSLVPVFVALVFVLLLTLVLFTSFFGV